MQFEHLVEINDPANPLIPALSRADLWFGLMCRAEDPRAFLPGLERCEIIERSDTVLTRRLAFGTAVIHDQVTLHAEHWVRFDSAATGEHAGGSLTISIEEPERGHLFLRFAYTTTLPEDARHEDGAYAQYIKSAYHQSDLDTVRVIRMIAESSRLQ